jgi:hypothetical protein
MSEVIDMCEGDSDGEWPNTASVPSRLLSRKRRRDKEASSNEYHPRNENCPRDETATEFGADLELADEVEVSVSPHKKRRGVDVRSERSANNDLAGNCAQILKGIHATEQDVGNEDSEETSRDDGSADEYSQKLPTSKPPSNGSAQQRRVSAWEDRLCELANYLKIHGNCNVPLSYGENPQLAKWVANQRTKYNLRLKGKTSPMTLSRIQALESLGFEWDSHSAVWKDRMIELANYRKIHGHCNVPHNFSENPKLGAWVTTQRTNYWLHVKGKKSQMTLSRIRALESLSFRWKLYIGRGEGKAKKASVDEEATDFRERAVEAPVHMQHTQEDFIGRESHSNQVDVAFEPEE